MKHRREHNHDMCTCLRQIWTSLFHVPELLGVNSLGVLVGAVEDDVCGLVHCERSRQKTIILCSQWQSC